MQKSNTKSSKTIKTKTKSTKSSKKETKPSVPVSQPTKVETNEVDYINELSQGKQSNDFTSSDAANPSTQHRARLQFLERRESLANITFDTDHDEKLVGTWQLQYTGYQSLNTTIIFKPSGDFLQVAGNYNGKWRTSGFILQLEYTSLKLPNESGPITLQCELNTEKDTYRGTKTHPSYGANGCIYVGEKLKN
eukprot:TRINITY_DN6707_c0_g1_i2.p1 TRINITY_DN6707_c0_g1~~TRINITY_DN6707_c0_g1_i2.p1  ORF type:complete len:193 (-),score=33.40 TRINITY_DN6707_c0_g1_i2:40-618(-)